MYCLCTGDMFGADWRNIYNATAMFANYTIDITDKLEVRCGMGCES